MILTFGLGLWPYLILHVGAGNIDINKNGFQHIKSYKYKIKTTNPWYKNVLRKILNFDNHYNPFCAFFTHSNKQQIGVIVSDIALIICFIFAYNFIYTNHIRGVKIDIYAIINSYVLPCIINQHWFALFTILHHTDIRLPRYKKTQWTWLRGIIGTIDRDCGIYNSMHHHVGDTHFIHHIHHLFSNIPHFNAKKATKYLLKNCQIMKKYYIDDNDNNNNNNKFQHFYRDISNCGIRIHFKHALSSKRWDQLQLFRNHQFFFCFSCLTDFSLAGVFLWFFFGYCGRLEHFIVQIGRMFFVGALI